MTSTSHRHLTLLALAEPLRKYASRLEDDVNAIYRLVHDALVDAFAEDPEAQPSTSLEASLQRRIDLQQTPQAV